MHLVRDASEVGLVVPDDLEIVFDHEDQTTPSVDAASYPRVEPKSSFVEIAALIGRTIREMSEGVPSPPQRVIIPVEFHTRQQKPNNA